MASIELYKDYCHKYFSDTVKGSLYRLETCGLAVFQQLKQTDDIYYLIMFDAGDRQRNRDHDHQVIMIHWRMIQVGLLFYFMKFELVQRRVVRAMVLLNIGLSVPVLFYMNTYKRLGVDYTSYISQASAVYKGERDYMKIHGNLGPAYYPAGNIWQYMPAYLLHMYTEDAEFIMKALHILIHTCTIVLATKISFIYFYDGKRPTTSNLVKSPKAQMVAIILLSNKLDKEYYNLMYNDEIMVIYLLLTIYFAITNCPIKASIFLALAMSIKLTAVLIIPAFLGITMANHGVPTLFKSIGIILAFQVIVALPFLLGETSLKDYFLRCIKYHDKMFPLTSTFTGSIFFKYFSYDFYYRKNWGMFQCVRILSLSLTVYHFFIRKRMLKPCL